LFLTIVQREVEGDVFFPAFEDSFEEESVLRAENEFCIVHYKKRGLN